jgi:chromosome segregation ATPase
MNEKDVFENRLNQLQTELDSEKQRAERLQSEDGECERLAMALEAERVTVRELKLCVDAQEDEHNQLKADRESESVPRLQQLIEENQRLRSGGANVGGLAQQIDQLQAEFDKIERGQNELRARR